MLYAASVVNGCWLCSVVGLLLHVMFAQCYFVQWLSSSMVGWLGGCLSVCLVERLLGLRLLKPLGGSTIHTIPEGLETTGVRRFRTPRKHTELRSQTFPRGPETA